VADEELSPDKPDANRHLTSTRQKALEGWFLKRESLRKTITGQAPLTFELYGGEEKVRMQILATDESIYYTLSKLTDDSQLKELYVYTAALVGQLRRGPIPSFVKAAPAHYAKTFPPAGGPPKKKTGAPKSVNETQRPPLQVLDAIIRLANEGFIPLHAPVQLVADKLGIGRDALTHQRRSLGGTHPWVASLREDWGGLPPEERAAKACERIEKETGLLRIARKERKRRATAKSADFSR
jgi:hypothetical protein